MLYLVYFYEGPTSKFQKAPSSLPWVLVSHTCFLSVLGLVGLFRLILILSAPIAFAKAAISGIHLVTAAQNIGNIDVDDRIQARNAKKN